MLTLNTVRRQYDYTAPRRLAVVKRVIAFAAELSATRPQAFTRQGCVRCSAVSPTISHSTSRPWYWSRSAQQYIVASKAQMYVRNPEGLERLVGAVGMAASEVPRLVADRSTRYDSEIATGAFVYNAKSNRFHHGLHQIRRVNKPAFWARHGYCYDYDIETAAATLMYQAYTRIGGLAVLATELKAYVDDKTAIPRLLPYPAQL